MNHVGILYDHLVYFVSIWCIFGHLVYLRAIWYINLRFGIFWVIWYILWPFGIVYGHLVYLFAFWYGVPRKIWQPWQGPLTVAANSAESFIIAEAL
jgi:hypothetical protein